MFKTQADDSKLYKTDIFQRIETSLQKRLQCFFIVLRRNEQSDYDDLSSTFVFESKKYIQGMYKTSTKEIKITTYHSMFDSRKIWDEIEYEVIVPPKKKPERQIIPAISQL
jgi:hypothetical protein